MRQLILHPYTAKQIEAATRKPSQALMIVGPLGSGKKTVALELVGTILGIADASVDPYVRHVMPEDGKAISIAAVRELERFLTLKVPDDRAYNRAVLIEDAHLLTTEAQNALLKTLEEPPAGTIIIMTVSHEQSLLPTIRSRAQTLLVKQPGSDELRAYFEDDHSAEAVKKSLAISSGLPGLMTAILTDEDHPLLVATARARQILQSDRYERLLLVDELAKDKALAADTLFILQQMAHVSLQSAGGAGARKWQNILTRSYDAAEALQANANAKLVLTDFMLNT